jgi:hypothetical protein
MTGSASRHYAGLPHGWLDNQYRKHALSLDHHMCEGFPFRDGLFDVPLMINILDHVEDAFQSLRVAHRILEPEDQFIFGHDLTEEADMRLTGKDVKHPMRFHRKDLQDFLSSRYEGASPNSRGRGEGRALEAHHGPMIHIGAKRL